MDDMRPFDSEGHRDEGGVADAPARDRHAEIGTDERRMQVRAYNFWVSMLGGRAYPSIEDLDPANTADFGPHSVLLDFTAGGEDPAITYIGESLRRECGIDTSIETVGDVPARSLLSRLTDHYLQILANRAPIGFEAEFVGQRGHNTLYRGILMPFSSDDDTIDFVYGVINWKELVDPAVEAGLMLEVAQALDAAAPSAAAAAPVWADGPGAGLVAEPVIEVELLPDAAPAPAAPAPADEAEAAALAGDAPLTDHLAAARALAEQAAGARLRSRAALYRALGLAYDFALVAAARPEDYAALLRDAGIKVQARAPMTAVVKLVFGAGIDKARATEFAAALACAARLALPAGGFVGHVEAELGGLKAMVAAERAARRPADAVPAHADLARAALRRAPPRAHVELPCEGAEFVLLLARREGDGRLAVLAPVPDEATLLDRAIRKITR